MTKITMPSEESLQRDADALAAEMYKTLSAILRRSAQALGATITAAAERPERAIFDQAEAAWMDAVGEEFFPRVVSAYADSAEAVHLQLVEAAGAGAPPVPFIPNQAALEYLRDAGNRMVNVSEGTWARARAQLIEGFQSGESIEQLATRLMNVSDWSRSRAETVARTEIISASNAGALAQLKATGAVAQKTWLATKDDRTREEHVVANGQTVNIHNVFIVCGEALDYPGDPEGEPGCIINCRCTMTFNVKKSDLTLALDDLPDVTDEFDPANFVDLDSLTAAIHRERVDVSEDAVNAASKMDAYGAMLEELRKRGRFDEKKHSRGKGGRFAPKPGGGGGKIDYTKPPKAKKKIDYTKPPKKQAPPEPPPAKKAAPPPPPPVSAPALPTIAKKVAKKSPAKKSTIPPPTPPTIVTPPAKKAVPTVAPAPTPPPAKKAVGKKTAPSAPPAQPPSLLDDEDLLAPAAAPTPAAPVVPVNQEVIDSLELSAGYYAAPGDRVLHNGRAGTVRGDVLGDDGLAAQLSVQFDDNPTALEEINALDAELIEDSDGFEDILKSPFPAAVAGAEEVKPPDSANPGPFPTTPGFAPMEPHEAASMQYGMLRDEPWTPQQRSALRTYSGDSYTAMNGCLRFDEGCSDKVVANNEDASAAMRPTTQNTTVFRGASFEALGVTNAAALESMVGAVVRDHGFTSTSVSPETAFTGNVTMQIDVPAGTPAAYIEGLTENQGEYELLLNAGTRFEIMAVSIDESSGHTNVHVRVVP